MEDRSATAPAEGAETERTSRSNLAIVIVAALGIVAAVIGLQLFQSGKFQPVGKGSVAPAFAFQNLEGKTVALDDYRGKVVFLNIWATWCDPCREEMPSMEVLYKKFQGRPFEILAVSTDKNTAEVGPFRAEFKLTFPILLDPRRRITRLYRATGVPETFIIDSKGIIAEKIIGARDWSAKNNIEKVERLVEEAEKTLSPVEGHPGPAPAKQPSK